MQPLKILVIDDDVDMREYAEVLLKRAHHEIVSFSSGDEAVDYIDNNEFDVALTDLMMPGSNDGLAVLKKVKEKDSTLAVVIMSAYASIDSAIEAMRAGADDYLCKPFNNDELLLRLEKIGREKEQRELLNGTEANKARAMHDLQMMVAQIQYKFSRVEQILSNKNVDVEKRVAKALNILSS